jgi:hypothetical protein
VRTAENWPSSRTHAVTAGIVVLGFLAAVARLSVDGPNQRTIALAFGAVIAIGEAMRITLPGGRDNAPLSATACLGYALVYRIGGHPANWTASQVVVVIAVAAAIGSVPQVLIGRLPSAGYLIRRVGVTGLIACIARTVLYPHLGHATHDDFLLVFSALACLGLLLDSAWAAVFAATTAPPQLTAAYFAQPIAYAQAEFGLGPEYGGYGGYGEGAVASASPTHPESAASTAQSAHVPDPAASTAMSGGSPGPAAFAGQVPEAEPSPDVAVVDRISVTRRLSRFFMVWVRECTATARICPAVAALAVAVALAADPLGLWVLPIAAAPILVMQRALRRYAAIRATYQQTIRALSRITDLAGYTEPGHARRVCRLALAIGRELGMTEPELLDLEYAALLHDLGQLSLADPLPGGATVTAAPEVVAEVAARGAEVVRQTGVLDRVAMLVEAQCTAYQDLVGGGSGRRGARASGSASTAPVSGEPALDEPGLDESALNEPGARRAAAVLRVANDFEDLRSAEPGPAAPTAALARIRLGDGRLYDPQAVAALARLVRVG